MKATAILLGNYDELVNAQKQQELLNLPGAKEIKPKSVEADFYFRMEALTTMFVAIDGTLKCQIAGVTVHLKNEPHVYEAIVNYLCSPR